MNIYVIIPTQPTHTKLDELIKKEFEGYNYHLPQGEWLVAFNGTSRELSDKLGISDGSNGSAIIVGISGYYGRASTDLWEWIRVKSE